MVHLSNAIEVDKKRFFVSDIVDMFSIQDCISFRSPPLVPEMLDHLTMPFIFPQSCNEQIIENASHAQINQHCQNNFNQNESGAFSKVWRMERHDIILVVVHEILLLFCFRLSW